MQYKAAERIIPPMCNVAVGVAAHDGHKTKGVWPPHMPTLYRFRPNFASG